MKIRKLHDVSLRKTTDRSTTALVAVYGNVDLQGDRLMPGSFTETLRKWRKSGDRVPAIFSHQWSDPMSFVGSIDPNTIRDTEQGLVVTVDWDVDGNPFAKQVKKLVEQRLMTQWSWAYDVIREKASEKDSANELLAVDLIEAGPTLRGANPLTGTLSGGEMLGRKSVQQMLANNTSTSTSTSVSTWTVTPVHAEVERYNRLIDELEFEQKTPAVDPVVDAFVTEVREELIQEALDRTKQAAWEERMGVNMVLDPVPVRIDGRMRPVTS